MEIRKFRCDRSGEITEGVDYGIDGEDHALPIGWAEVTIATALPNPELQQYIDRLKTFQELTATGVELTAEQAEEVADIQEALAETDSVIIARATYHLSPASAAKLTAIFGKS